MKNPFDRKPQLSQKELYDKLYKKSKIGGEQFIPDAVAKDAAVALFIVAAIVVLAILFPATSEAPADPTSTTYVPRPEWYFLFFFQFLKMFPGSLEPVSAVVIPTTFIILLLLVPFLSRGVDRSWSKRKLSVGLGVFVAVGVIALEVVGAFTSTAPSVATESPLVLSGQRVYVERQCSYCHSINGIGGAVGPDLSGIGGTLTKQQFTDYLQNPSSVTMHTLHPKLLFSTDELTALVEYLSSLGAQVPFTAQAPVLVQQHCIVCHTINGQGGSVGPNLSSEGSNRSLNFLENLISTPTSEIAGATMPAFKNVLTPAQINDVAAYLYSLRGTQPAPTSTPTSTPTTASTSTPIGSPFPTTTATPLVGAQYYFASCSLCHGVNRQGGTGSIRGPALTAAALVRVSDATIIRTITNGNGEMPPFSSVYTSAKIQDILTFLRSTAAVPTSTPTATATATATPVGGAVSYSATIQPILSASCACHGPGGPAGVSLTSYSATISTVVAGNATGSLLYNAVTGNGVTKMPPGGSLTTAQIQSITDWINQGAPNN